MASSGMTRHDMIERVGSRYMTANIEGGEFSYIQDAGSREKLEQAVGHKIEHFKLDIRFEDDNVAVLIETKQNFVKKDENQLKEYLEEEKALHPENKVICILANTNNNKIKVWKSLMDDEHLLKDEKVLDTFEHYKSLFFISKQNNREKVLKNTYALNETLHKKDIDERLRSQFVGTTLLYIRDVIKQKGLSSINDETRLYLRNYWKELSAKQIRSGIEETLTNLLDGSDNKALKIELLQKNVLNDQKVKKLDVNGWVDILDEIVGNIYKYINADSSEGQDILNLFFIAFNKYTGKADKNQAFTPDHITNFMCRVTGVDRTKRIFDGTCGSGSFLVQAMVLELADCDRQHATEAEKKIMRQKVAKEHIYGIEIEEKAFGLSTTNMLIHGDGNSNIKHDNLFYSEAFIREADPDIILMNPPYNAKPISIPASYKSGWKSDAKEDPTKGMVFLKYISDVIGKMNDERLAAGKPVKEVKVAILLPVAAAIGTSSFISEMKSELLERNTLDAVFTLPNEIFYPGASASACCMVFTLGKPHVNADDTVNKTFFGYYKDDGHKKKKNLGRVEQFDSDNNSIWKRIEEDWLDYYRNKTVKDGISAMQAVTGDDEWLCEAYMKTDYSKLTEADFQQTINNYLAYLMKEGKVYES
jgi:type I restriction-modification system DNA methylase subunit